MHANTSMALAAGRRRWLDRMRALKALGLIAKFPNGRRPRGSPRLAKDATIARAQRIVEREVMAKKVAVRVTSAPPGLPALPAKPRSAMALPEKLDHAANTALDRIQDLLDREIDPTDTKTLGMQTTAALTIIGQKVRVDESRMRQPAEDHGLIEYEAAVARQERLFGLRPGKPKPKNKASGLAEETS